MLPLWRGATTLAAPLLRLHLRRRAARGKEMAARLPEREGHGAARPPGRLLWLHAASVGETQSALPLLDALAEADPSARVLLTTGTVTSARLTEARLPAALAGRVLHRFAPLDVPAWVARFLDGWRPDLGVFVESELWPNLIEGAAARGIPLALVNARMSARSARLWRASGAAGRRLLGRFGLIAAQGEADAARFAALGAVPVVWGNLKHAAPPLPADEAELAALSAALGGRPAWIAASTHPGEEAAALAAHRALATRIPGLLTILAPRHPERGEEVAALARDLPLARRSLGERPGPATQVLLFDTIGELGLAYRLARVAFVGGSLVPRGGQNPVEPARLGLPVLVGPRHANFAETVAALRQAGALRVLPGAGALAEAVSAVLTDADTRRRMAEAGLAWAGSAEGLPARLAAALLRLARPD
ncbi:MAG: 3-deoxy-D-manno-octulosonic acid transferase [Acetobacteraceae bacterium]|nr:3-deoxy-D-manno-octulosonic acid transferase [Acetobacteraceae bacterium]MDW8397466.1 3-deoxy-D-manno-octulosonic acid transferase [Acetobacteraceae bacterium]